MSNWNFADLYEGIASRVPDHPCQIQGDRIITWGQFDARTNALAADMLAAGLKHQSKGLLFQPFLINKKENLMKGVLLEIQKKEYKKQL